MPTQDLTNEDRACRACGERKPLDLFPRHKTSVAGRAHTCRACNGVRHKLYRQRPGVIQKDKEWRAEWYYERGGKAIVKKNRDTFHTRNGYKALPDAKHANNLAQRAIRSGRIIRKDCEVCGESPTHAHHDDYNLPLAVRWLCEKCHRAWHAANKPIRALK